MKRIKREIILMIISLEVVGTGLFAQTQFFTYSKSDNNQQFRSDSISITFTKYVNGGSGILERSATFSDHRYKLSVKKNRLGKIEEFRSEDGTLLATEFLDGDDPYSLLLSSDGETLKWRKTDSHHWAYRRNDKNVIAGEYKKTNATKQVALQTFSSPDEIVLIAFMERSSDVIVLKSNGALLGVTLGLGLVGALMRTSDTSH